MADTTFVAKVTQILASWLNDINVAVYRAIGAGGNAPTTPADVRTNLGLSATTAPTGASLIGLSGANASVQAHVTALASSSGAGLVGTAAAGDLSGGTVAAQITELDSEKASLLHGNNWAGAGGNGDQKLDYTVPATAAVTDHVGWQALVHKPNGGNTNNVVALVGHAYHDGNFNSPNGVWGIATEAWSNPTNYATLVGGELSVISQCPTMGNPIVGMNAVFKNRLDTAANPTAAVAAGSEYNHDSAAVLITSQQRPSGAGAAWQSVGSGWQTAIRIGQVAGGPGLDWEGGSYFPGSATKKAYTSIIDATAALTDMAGSPPWFVLYKNSATYWGMRFNGTLTGALKTYNIVVNNGGAGYAFGDTGNITGGGGTGAKYLIQEVAAGVATSVLIMGQGGSGYTASVGAATATLTGGGAGLTLDITIGTGLIYGANIGITAAGAGYFVGELVAMNGGTVGYRRPVFKVLTIGGGGAVTSVEMQTDEMVGFGANTPMANTNGRGHTVGAGKTTTSLTGAGAGLTLNVTMVYNDLLIGGERWEFWRMLNPSNPTSSGARHGFIDSSFPGTPLTIDTSGATYTFPVDRPM